MIGEKIVYAVVTVCRLEWWRHVSWFNVRTEMRPRSDRGFPDTDVSGFTIRVSECGCENTFQRAPLKPFGMLTVETDRILLRFTWCARQKI